MTDEQEREFWLMQRSGLLKQIEAIEKIHLPEKWAEREAYRSWQEAQRRKRVVLT